MFKTDTFRGGIHPLKHIHEGKRATQNKETAFLVPPTHIIIPMSQSAGTTCDPLVAKGERVLYGQKIGEPRGFVGAPVHSSVSGVVLVVEQREVQGGVFCQCVVVENDGLDEPAPRCEPLGLDADPAKIIAAVREAGIVGMGGAAFPTHIKLSPPQGKTVDTVIVNGAECEPFLNSDNRLMLEAGERVVKGLSYALRALNASRGIIAIEKNKPEAIAKLRELIQGDERIAVRALKVKYPQGSEKQLIIATTARQVPSGGLPADAGCVVINAATAAAITDALTQGKPLTERIVTVAGCVAEPRNLRARIGTPISALLEACGGLLPEAGRVVSGGPMMGIAVYNENSPVVKGTSGILALTGAQIDPGEKTACIHCARCAKGCPMHLMPMKLRDAATMQDWDAASAYHALDCVECGSCTYSCPAKLEILSNIRIAKRTLIARLKR